MSGTEALCKTTIKMRVKRTRRTGDRAPGRCPSPLEVPDQGFRRSEQLGGFPPVFSSCVDARVWWGTGYDQGRKLPGQCKERKGKGAEYDMQGTAADRDISVSKGGKGGVVGGYG